MIDRNELLQIYHYLDDFQEDNPVGDEWVIVYTAGTEYEAELVKGRLLEHEIPTTVLNQSDSMRPFTFGSLSIYKVMVQEEYSEKASRILAEPI